VKPEQEAPTADEIVSNVRALAEACVKSAREVGGVTLDYSSSSVSMLDVFVGQFWPQGKKGADTEIPGAILAAGAYLGEVIIRNAPSTRWTRPTGWHGNVGQPSAVIEFPRGEQADPATWVYKRIMEGQAKRDLRRYYDVALKLAAGTVSLKEIGRPWPWWKRLRARVQR
jgi:hypothetical protein